MLLLLNGLSLLLLFFLIISNKHPSQKVLIFITNQILEINTLFVMKTNINSFEMNKLIDSLSSNQNHISIRINSAQDFIVSMANILYITSRIFLNLTVSLYRSQSHQFYLQIITGLVSQDGYQQQTSHSIINIDADFANNKLSCQSPHIEISSFDQEICLCRAETISFDLTKMTYIFLRLCEGLPASFYFRISHNQTLEQQSLRSLQLYFRSKNINIEKINSHCLLFQMCDKVEQSPAPEAFENDLLVYLKQSFHSSVEEKMAITLKIREVMKYVLQKETGDKEQKYQRIKVLKYILKMCSYQNYTTYLSFSFKNEQNKIPALQIIIQFQFETVQKFNQLKTQIYASNIQKCFTFQQKMFYEQAQHIQFYEIIKINQQQNGDNKEYDLLHILKTLQDPFQYKNNFIHNSTFRNTQKMVKGYDDTQFVKQYQKSGIYDNSVFAQINKLLIRNNVLKMKNHWDGGFRIFLQQLIKHWDIYKQGYRNQVIRFIKINDYKQFLLKQIIVPELSTQQEKSKSIVHYYQYLYPGINKILDNFRNKLNMPTLSQKANSQFKERKNVNQIKPDHLQAKNKQFFTHYLGEEPSNYFDKILIYFVEECQTKRLRQGKILVSQSGKQKIGLGEYIYELVKFDEKIKRLQNLLSFILAQYNRINGIAISRGQKQFANNICYQRVMQTKCLGCSTFFYKDINFIQQNHCQTPYKIFPSVTQIKTYEAVIKDYISAMLNSGGGIILFDCQAEYKTVKAKGELMTEKQKQQYEQRIYSLLKYFSPELKINKEILVTFVPLIKNPYIHTHTGKLLPYSGEQAIQRPNQYYFDREYEKGCYITRIRVNPTEIERMYFWSNIPISEQIEVNYEVNVYCSVLKDNVRKELTNKQIVHYMKERFRKCYVPQKDNRYKRIWGNFNHDCLTPQRGWIVDDNNSKQQQIKKNTSQYCNLAILIAKPANLKQIQSAFKQNKIKCELEIPNERNHFKKAKKSILMYHNKTFQELLFLIKQNKQFIFSGRSTLIIKVTNYLKLDFLTNESMKPEQYKNLNQWLKAAFPDEELSVWAFKTIQDSKIQYFISTQSQRSIVFMYFFFMNYDEKVIFKNPFHIDLLSSQQKKQRLIKIYGDNHDVDHSFLYDRLIFRYKSKIALIPKISNQLKEKFKLEATSYINVSANLQNSKKYESNHQNSEEIIVQQSSYIPRRYCIYAKQVQL